MRYATVLIGLAAALFLGGCREEERHPVPATPAAATVPDLYGDDLDEAEEHLDSLGISYTVDSGDDQVVFEHLWTVCDQSPGPGAQARVVTLTVEHVCDG